MCGENKSIYIPEILYVYNTENPMNEHKINAKEQERIANFLRSKEPYKSLKNLYENE
jgi:hypothetical protein